MRLPGAILVVLAGSAFAQQSTGACRTRQVVSGDSCGSLASACGISGQDFITYNPQPNLCSSLAVGQYVCCSPGTLPNLKPKSQADGSCATHLVVSGEYCSLIAASNGITTDNIESFNHHTWGWGGCNALQAGQIICLSSGSPPMPAAIPGAICGPQMANTPKPQDMGTLAQLNPCPLSACCNNWGQCGTTAEFCTQSASASGAPGTTAPGTTGCISNCGMAVVNNNQAPSVFRQVGYYESWNGGRPCLNMAVSQIDQTAYTHIHFAFVGLDNNFNPFTSSIQEQWNEFVQMRGVKRIASFGGWTFSTDPSMYFIFRNAVSPANYQKFVQNIVSFVAANNLDGVDFDWEYPGEADIPGIPASSTADSAGYLQFLQALRAQLPSGKSISVATPASYWYLRGFPVHQIAQVIDYFVFMTYDLHGQWDYANKWAAEGCLQGSCLRSHVNYTETVNMLAMITKAGVPANQVVVGIASYGRSFQTSQAGCNGPMCTFTGPQSGAKPGRCTLTAGYISNAEISQIQAEDPTAKAYFDQSSDSMVMTWDDTQWVSYMDDNTRKSRIAAYRGMNMGGWVEWAVDLASFMPVVDNGSSSGPNRKRPIKLPTSLPTMFGPGASCQQLEDYQAQQGRSHGSVNTLSTYWDMVGASDVFEYYVNQMTNEQLKTFDASFCDSWGCGESFSKCDIHTGCDRLDCSNLDDPKSVNSAAAYMVMLSMSNFNSAMQKLYSATQEGQNSWIANEQIYGKIFENSQPHPPSNMLAEEILSGVGAIIGVIGAATLEPRAAGVVGALSVGISAGIIEALQEAEKAESETLVDLETEFSSKFKTTLDQIANVQYGSLYNGSVNSYSLEDAFAHGAWLDWHNIPLLNPTLVGSDTALSDIMALHYTIATINWAWGVARTWVMSYPMSQQEFDGHVAVAGDNDSRLKHYYKGRGYFFQAVFKDNGNIPTVQNPPGWGDLDQFGITTANIIESSANGFEIGGYNYSIADHLKDILNHADVNFLKDTVSLPGIFRIPQCTLNERTSGLQTVDDFFDVLAAPGAAVYVKGLEGLSSFCACLGLRDSNGVAFEDVVDVKEWKDVCSVTIGPDPMPKGGGGGVIGGGHHQDFRVKDEL